MKTPAELSEIALKRENRIKAIQSDLSLLFEQILGEADDTLTEREIRELIANYTMGYTGASFGLVVK